MMMTSKIAEFSSECISVNNMCNMFSTIPRNMSMEIKFQYTGSDRPKMLECSQAIIVSLDTEFTTLKGILLESMLTGKELKVTFELDGTEE